MPERLMKARALLAAGRGGKPPSASEVIRMAIQEKIEAIKRGEPQSAPLPRGSGRTAKRSLEMPMKMAGDIDSCRLLLAKDAGNDIITASEFIRQAIESLLLRLDL
jgi:Arc/MetJ-type ribon-helix-helix transcriptional regulator